MRSIFINSIFLVVVIFLAYLFSHPLGYLDENYLKQATGFWDLGVVVGFVMGYFLFLPILYIPFGDRYSKYYLLAFTIFPVLVLVFFVHGGVIQSLLSLAVGLIASYGILKLKTYIPKKEGI